VSSWCGRLPHELDTVSPLDRWNYRPGRAGAGAAAEKGVVRADVALSEDQAVLDRSVGYTKSGGGNAWKPNTDTLPSPQSGYVITALANLDPPAAQRLADFAANRLPEK